jgi:4,5-dihydroxyphthalate decarboxylase
MIRQPLTAVTRTQGNNRLVKDGTVTPAGFAFEFDEVPVLVNAFRRMVRTLEFDVCEMAFTTYLCAREHGVAFTAIPVFLVRGFHHGAIQVRADASVTHPRDLEGRRVGVSRGYTVTTGVWARGILATEYGVQLDRVTWVLSGDEHVESYRPPGNVVAAPPGADLADLLVAGEIDAVVGAAIDRPDVVPLIAEPTEAAFRALVDDGLYPINHLVVIRDDVLAEHPKVAAAVFDAFAEAKQRYVDQLLAGRIDQPSPTDEMYLRVHRTTGADPLPYGVEPNRAMIEALVGHASSQGILSRPTTADEIFHPSVRNVSA